jgi:hypothetical protein
MTALIVALLMSAGPDELLRELEGFRKAMRDKKGESIALRKAAHESLDAGAYEEAVQRHRRSRDLEREIGDLKKKEQDVIAKVVPLLLPLLDDDSADVRNRTSLQLVSLGSLGIPHLEALEGEGSAELQSRLADVLGKLRQSSLDDEGRVRQWAVSARASSEYGPDSWAAKQATGKPDTVGAGDIRTAWASRVADGGEEWLELTYEQPVMATHVRIHETFNPGAVRKVEARDAEGNWQVLWEGTIPTLEPERWLLIGFRRAPIATSTIRVVLDSAGVPGWNEIDAVELIGDPKRGN